MKPFSRLTRRATLYKTAGLVYAIRGDGLHIPSAFDIDMRVADFEEVEIIPAERKQAVAVLVPRDSTCDNFYAIVCDKGQGVILPDGKVEKDESLADAAKRVLNEETGLRVAELIPIFSSPIGPHDVTTFVGLRKSGKVRSSEERQVVLAYRENLLASHFKDYYVRMFKAFDAWNNPNG